MTSRSLKIDRSKQANIVVDTVEQYNALPHNKVDLYGYDTKYSKQEEKAQIGKRILTKSQLQNLRKAQSINKKRDYQELKKALKTTINVLSLSEVDKWAKKPNKYDIENVDTQPHGLIGLKSNFARLTLTETPTPIRSKNMGLGHLGSYYYGGKKEKEIHLNAKYKPYRKKEYQTAYAHEIGHGIHYQKLDIKKFNDIERKELKKVAFDINPMSNNASNSFKEYRNSYKELFADYFSGLVVDHRKASKQAPTITKELNYKFPKLIKGFKMQEEIYLDKHIKKIKKITL